MGRSCDTCFRRIIDACPRTSGPYTSGNHRGCYIPSQCAANDAFDEIAAIRAELEQAKRERDAAVEAIKCPSVCDQCVSHCDGDDECIDNGYMNFEWRGVKAKEESENDKH